MQGSSITARDLACRRGDRLLLRGLSFDCPAGSATRLAGANGIGKSSLLRICAGLLRPYSGTVARVGTVGLVDERPALDAHLPLARALAFWGGMDGVGADRMSEHLERLGLGRLGEVPTRYLSTGQKKRAALARLLGQGAAIWLLDEPLNGLDTQGTELVSALAADHCARGGIVVAASHQEFPLAGMVAIDLADHAA